MRNIVLLRAASILTAVTCPVAAYAQSGPAKPSAEPAFLDQGWSANDRTRFHTASQGLQLMPYSRLIALERTASEAMCLNDELTRLEYVPQQQSRLRDGRSPDGLHIGFVRDADEKRWAWIGMTYAACHTNQVEFEQSRLQIGGGPATDGKFAFLEDFSWRRPMTQEDITATC